MCGYLLSMLFDNSEKDCMYTVFEKVLESVLYRDRDPRYKIVEFIFFYVASCGYFFLCYF
ncbi:MAG: hypothetical protein CL916_03010 [Deltaproteobacteria bacterium]|nr:hypothetical protein [Deltaproteobacteria bacterium]